MSDDFGEWETNQQSVNLMSDIMSAFTDIEEGRPVPKKLPDGSKFVNDFSQINRTETENLLKSLHEVTGEYGNIHKEYAQCYGLGDYNEDYNDSTNTYGNYEPQEGETFIQDPSYVKMKQVKIPNNEPVPKSELYVTGQNWSIVEESVLGMKSAKVYSIKCNSSNQIIMNNIMMYESALALKTILNDGKTLTDPKVLGIISSGIQYTRVVTEAINAAKKRQQVLKESRYDKAQELDNEIAEYKSKASELKDRVLNFLRDEGFMNCSN